MKQTARILSTYSADTFGVCSALYELGGMVVIHDPSGCNSTYTTHDEPRWFSKPSQIFVSALTEQDAILYFSYSGTTTGLMEVLRVTSPSAVVRAPLLLDSVTDSVPSR